MKKYVIIIREVDAADELLDEEIYKQVIRTTDEGDILKIIKSINTDV